MARANTLYYGRHLRGNICTAPRPEPLSCPPPADRLHTIIWRSDLALGRDPIKTGSIPLNPRLSPSPDCQLPIPAFTTKTAQFIPKPADKRNGGLLVYPLLPYMLGIP